MKKQLFTTKRLLSLLIAVIMVVSMLPISAVASLAADPDYTELTYNHAEVYDTYKDGEDFYNVTYKIYDADRYLRFRLVFKFPTSISAPARETVYTTESFDTSYCVGIYGGSAFALSDISFEAHEDYSVDATVVSKVDGAEYRIRLEPVYVGSTLEIEGTGRDAEYNYIERYTATVAEMLSFRDDSDGCIGMTLCRDVTENIVIPEGRDVGIHTNGYTIQNDASKKAPTITNNGTFQLYDYYEGSVIATGRADENIAIVNNGRLTIGTRGTVKAFDSNENGTAYCCAIDNRGDTLVEYENYLSTITAISKGGKAVAINNTGDLTVENSKITATSATSDACAVKNEGGVLDIEDGNITAIADGGDAVVVDITDKAETNTEYETDVNIDGGDFSAVCSDGAAVCIKQTGNTSYPFVIKGGLYIASTTLGSGSAINTSGTELKIKGGEFRGALTSDNCTIIGGKFVYDPTDYVPATHRVDGLTDEECKYTVRRIINIVEVPENSRAITFTGDPVTEDEITDLMGQLDSWDWNGGKNVIIYATDGTSYQGYTMYMDMRWTFDQPMAGINDEIEEYGMNFYTIGTVTAGEEFDITVEAGIEGGTVSAPSSSYDNKYISLDSEAASGYTLERYRVYKADDPTVEVEVFDGYYFVMPEFDVVVTADFIPDYIGKATVKYSVLLDSKLEMDLRISGIGKGFNPDLLEVFVDGEEASVDYNLKTGFVTGKLFAVSPEKMADSFTLTFKYNGKVFECKEDVSVERYFRSVKHLYAMNSTIVDLCEKALNYGAYAEFAADPELIFADMAYFDMEDEEMDYTPVFSTKNSKAQSASLILGDDVTLEITYSEAVDASKVVVKNQKGEQVRPEYIKADGNKLLITNRTTDKLANVYTVTMGSDVVTYSAYDYLYAAQNSAGAGYTKDNANLCLALYLYAEACAAYNAQ